MFRFSHSSNKIPLVIYDGRYFKAGRKLQFNVTALEDGAPLSSEDSSPLV